MRDERIAKLPKWAQGLIKQQEAEIRGLRETIAAMQTEPGDGPITYRAYGPRVDGGLPPGSIVRFQGWADYGDAWIDVNFTPRVGNGIQVCSGRGLVVRPICGNVIGVEWGDF